MKFYIFVLFVILFIFSCLPAHYIHTPLIVSDIEKKGDYNISGSFATSSEAKNFNFNGNYAVTNHWILQASITNRNYYLKDSKYDSKGSCFDVAFGYTNISSDKNFYIENFIGYGSGKFKNIGIEDINNFANFGYNKVFSQLNFYYRLNSADENTNTFSFHFPIRIAYVHFNEIKYNSTENGFEIRQIEFLKENPNKWMISIGKTISYRFNDVKLSVFGSYHSPTKADEFITFGNIYFGIGFSWRNFFKQKKEILQK
jgi:hypothetical protein